MRSVLENPETWIWKPEKLKYILENTWSRRVNLEHRMVYSINNINKIIFFLHFRYYYN